MSDQTQDDEADEKDKGGSPPDAAPAADDGARRYPQRAEQQPHGADKPKPKRRWGLILLAIVVVVIVVAAVLWWIAHRNQITTDDAYTNGRAVTVAPRVAGQVVSLDVNDNEYVHAGQLLIAIDPSDYIAARDQAQGQLLAVEAQLANAQSNLEIQKVTQPARLAQARAQLVSAQANQTQAELNYRRFHAINPAATTRQDIDAATATERQAKAQVDQAEAAVNQASTVSLDIQQASAQIKQLRGQVEQARAELAKATLNLSYTRVVAPQDGWITQRNVEKGNYVQVGATIFALVTPQVWVTANFKEDQLTRMQPGQRVNISVDAYPGLHLTGHVDSIQLGSGSKFSAFPAENATGNFVKIVQRVPVKIDIDSGLLVNQPLPLGISVEPTVYVK
jgi:membrane fusion protein (multidrug efflux system)